MAYFSSIPTTFYNGKECRDISRRVVLRDLVTADRRAFQPLTVTDGVRTDEVAQAYYGNPGFEWLVFLSTGAIDPYFGWRVSDTNFIAFIEGKYGSIVRAAETVVHYQSNWYSGEDITVEGYGQLWGELRRYYEAVTDEVVGVLRYSRRREDQLLATNMAAEVTLVAGGEPLAAGRLTSTAADGSPLGSCSTASTPSADRVLIQHVEALPVAGGFLGSEAGGAPRQVGSVRVLGRAVPVGHEAFWEPVSALAWERERNERNRSVRLLDSRYLQEVEEELRLSMLEESPV